MHRVVIDTHVIDWLVDNPNLHALDAIRSAVESGTLDLTYTHVVGDEISKTQGTERRHLLLSMLEQIEQFSRLVPTGAMVLGYSRLGLSRLGGTAVSFEEFRRGNMPYTYDSLIAATAQLDQCAIVTIDEKLTKRARAQGINVLTPDELLILIR